MKSIHNLADIGISPTSRILVFMPHPDDEAVFISGLLQKISKHNPNLKLIAVTAGEQSTHRFGLKSDKDLARARKYELGNALSIIGVSDHQVWDFTDGGLEANFSNIVPKIKSEIDKYQPTHIITLEPDGIYGHPDHVALSLAVTQSCHLPVKLLYATVSPRFFVLQSSKKMAQKSNIKPIKPAFKLRLTPGESLTKIKALKAHQSQFKIDLWHQKTLFYFLINDLIFHEYYAYRKIDL